MTICHDIFDTFNMPTFVVLSLQIKCQSKPVSCVSIINSHVRICVKLNNPRRYLLADQNKRNAQFTSRHSAYRISTPTHSNAYFAQVFIFEASRKVFVIENDKKAFCAVCETNLWIARETECYTYVLRKVN